MPLEDQIARLTLSVDEQARKLDRLTALVEQLAARSDSDRLLPLSDIIGGTANAARARLRRDSELRALAVPVGKRLMFRRTEVEMFLRQRREGRAA